MLCMQQTCEVNHAIQQLTRYKPANSTMPTSSSLGTSQLNQQCHSCQPAAHSVAPFSLAALTSSGAKCLATRICPAALTCMGRAHTAGATR